MKTSMKSNYKSIYISVQEILYYVFFGLLLFAKGIGLYEGMMSFNICIAFSLIFITIKLLMTEYTVTEWIGIVAIMLCSIIAYLNTGEKAVIITCLTIIGMKSIPLKRIMKIAFFIWTFTFYGMLIVHLFGWKEEILLAHNKFGLGFILRHSLGFPHPNVLHISFVIWMALFLYLVPQNKKQMMKASIFLLFENIYIFIYSVSITGFLLGILYLGLNLYLTSRERKLSAPEKAITMSILPLCIFTSVIPPLLFQGKLYDVVNKLLNTRLKIWRYYLTTFTPKLFGTKIWSPEEEILSLDCSYLYLLYYYGIILFILIMGLFGYVIWNYIQKDGKKELAIILGMLIAGITEPYLFNFSFKNIILLFSGSVLFEVLRKQKGKTIAILPFCNRDLEIKCPDSMNSTIKKIRDANSHISRKSRTLMTVSGIALGMIVLTISWNSYQKPDHIYVRSERCDYVKGDGITLDDIQRENSLVYGYTDEETLFYGFDGNMIILEQIRISITGGVLGFFSGVVLFWCILCYNQLMPNRKRESL